MRLATYLLFVSLMVVGCGPEVPTTPPVVPAETPAKVTGISHPKELMPLVLGNSWTFAVTGRLQQSGKQPAAMSAETVIKVIDVQNNSKGIKGAVQVLTNMKPISKVGFFINDEGVFQTGAFEGQMAGNFEPPLPIVFVNADIGRAIVWKGKGVRPAFGGVGPIDGEVTMRGMSEVDTEAGRMKALRVDTILTFKVNGKQYKADQSAWLVPRIGIVRTIEAVTGDGFARATEMKLKSYTVK